MKFFKSFKWPVPQAFHLALFHSEFTYGDIFYNTVEAYRENWESSKQKIALSIQVLSNIKSDPKLSGTFVDNWMGKLKICLRSFNEGRVENERIIDTYQGNLFMFLYEGYFELLEKKNPVMLPLIQADVHKRINFVRKEKTKKHQFIKIYNESSLSQMSDLALLKKEFNITNFSSNVYAFGVSPFDGIAVLPTIKIVILDTDYTKTEITQKVKNVYYKPAKSSEKEIFILKRHGILR